jgi:hypothetical protein
MKKNALMLVLLALSMHSCKKDKQDDNQNPLEIVVTGLTVKTSITIIADDQNNKRILEVSNKFGNATYKTAPVNSGDVLRIHYNSNLASDIQNNGNGNLSFYYKGQNRGAAGGNLNYPKGNEIKITIP